MKFPVPFVGENFKKNDENEVRSLKGETANQNYVNCEQAPIYKKVCVDNVLDRFEYCITKNETANLLNITKRAVEKQIKSGKIKALLSETYLDTGPKKIQWVVVSSLDAEHQEAFWKRMYHTVPAIFADIENLPAIARAVINFCMIEAKREEDCRKTYVKHPATLDDDRVGVIVKMLTEGEKIPFEWDRTEKEWRRYVAGKYGYSLSQYYRLRKRRDEGGFEGIVHGNKYKDSPKKWDEEAIKYWIGLVLKKEHRKMSMTVLYSALKAEAKKNRWKIGSYSSAAALVKKIPAPLIAYRDKGIRGLDNALPPILRAYETLEPFEIIVGDQHRFDFWVRDDFTGAVFRPEGYLWQDLCTRTLYGIAVAKKYDAYLMGSALKTGLKIYGKFKCVYNDNGRPEHSKFFLERKKHLRKSNMDLITESIDIPDEEGVLVDLGAKQRFAIVRNAKAKMIESTFRFIEQMLINEGVPGSVTTLGADKEQNDVTNKELEQLKKSGKLLTFSEFCLELIRVLDKYNAKKPHRGLIDQYYRETRTRQKDLSPHKYLAYRLSKGWKPEFMSDSDLDLIFKKREKRTIKNGRILLRHEYYESDALTGFENGTKVEIRYDYMLPSAGLNVFKDGQYICDAYPVQYSFMNNKEVTSDKIAEKRKIRRKFIDVYNDFTKPAEDLRKYSKAGCEDVFVPQIPADKPKVINPDEIEAEKKRIEEIVAKHEEQERNKELEEANARPDFFLSEFERYKWCHNLLIKGGVLSDEDKEFFEEYEEKMGDAVEVYKKERELCG